MHFRAFVGPARFVGEGIGANVAMSHDVATGDYTALGDQAEDEVASIIIMTDDVTGGPDVAHVAQPARVMNWWKLAALSYVAVSGGPFGLEQAIQAGGALPTLILIGVLAVFWALPQALMTAEMSTIFSVNGGYIVVRLHCIPRTHACST